MSLPRKFVRIAAAAGLIACLTGAAKPALDPANPTCPLNPDWSAHPAMKLTPVVKKGGKVLLAEGRIDAGLPERLKAVLAANPDIGEVWLRSPGGDARAGNSAGRIIRSNFGLTTRIPAGWACFSACNFVFMGGQPRVIDPGASSLSICSRAPATAARST